MENSMSRMLMETLMKKALKAIQDSPERGIRNLIDMALLVAEGRSQQNFFSAAQTMLQNENSAYYGLVRDVFSYVDIDRLHTLGMNLGCNGCAVGAQRIRENEKKLRCRIPWAMILQMDQKQTEEQRRKYHSMIGEGESLGIYMWMIFAAGHPEEALPFAKDHPDSAFCIFCRADDLTPAFLDEAAERYNVMLMVRYEENASEIYGVLQKMGLLYSVWHPYGQADTETITSGDLFDSIQQLKPVFTVLLPEQNCPKAAQDRVCQTIKQMRDGQTYSTLLWELQRDNSLIDTLLSGGACSVCFDGNGDLYNWSQKIECEHHNLFRDSLSEILMDGCAGKTPAGSQQAGAAGGA